MKSTQRVTGGKPLLAIGYKYNYRKILGFIATEGTSITEPGDPYLSCLPDIYSNVSVCPVVLPHLIGYYLNSCNNLDNQNRMLQSDLTTEKYWMTQIGYFRLEATLELCIGITDGNILLCHGI